MTNLHVSITEPEIYFACFMRQFEMLTALLTLKELLLKVALGYDGSNRRRSSDGTKQTSDTSTVPACITEGQVLSLLHDSMLPL